MVSFNLATLDNSSKGTLVSNGELRASISQQLDNHDGGLLSAKACSTYMPLQWTTALACWSAMPA